MNSLVHLRRMIINQKPARIDYTVKDQKKSQYYDRAGFEGSHKDVTDNLRKILESKSVEVVTEGNIKAPSSQRVFAPQAVSAALAGYAFNAEMRAGLLSFTMRLPPLIVRLFPLQRYAFQDNAAYMKMHMQYQHNGVLRMQNYIAQSESYRDEVIRLRVMVCTYLLGLIAPLNPSGSRSHTKTQRVQTNPSGRQKKAGILARIISRIRGL